jgi:hypothetical protein
MGRRVTLVVAALSGCVTEPPATTISHTQTFASLAGVDGVVTTLAFYDGGGAHPGTNAIDIGALGGTAVFHQIDYLPPTISGGWIWVGPVHEAGRCSQWWPGSPYYNGDKIYVHAYLYDTDGNFAGTHRSAFQHVDPFADHMNTWWSWNNPAASALAFPDGAHLTYGDQGNGGLYLGTVHAVGASITNGPTGALCTTGSHLHQEADGWRAGQRWVGEWLGGRYSDLHYFDLSSAWSAGAPPWNPVPGLPWTPPEDPPPPDPPTDPTYFDEHGLFDLGVARTVE